MCISLEIAIFIEGFSVVGGQSACFPCSLKLMLFAFRVARVVHFFHKVFAVVCFFFQVKLHRVTIFFLVSRTPNFESWV